jgi:hypothetical protein
VIREIFALIPASKSDRPDQISNIAEKANKDALAEMLGVAEADFEFRGPASNRSSSSSTRTTGVPDFAMAASVASRASSRTELHHSPGTEGSNPLWTSS